MVMTEHVTVWSTEGITMDISDCDTHTGLVVRRYSVLVRLHVKSNQFMFDKELWS